MFMISKKRINYSMINSQTTQICLCAQAQDGFHCQLIWLMGSSVNFAGKKFGELMIVFHYFIP